MSQIVTRLVAALLIVSMLLFVPAGSLTWIRGWLFLLVFVMLVGVAGVYLWQVNTRRT
jgi:hypothetical protein